MAATFGCPVSAVLLAIELLLFEFRRGRLSRWRWPARRPPEFGCCCSARTGLRDERISAPVPLSGAGVLRRSGTGPRPRGRGHHSGRLCDRGRLRSSAHSLDVVARSRRRGRGRRSATSAPTRWASVTTTSRSISRPRPGDPRRRRSVRDEVRFVVDFAGQRHLGRNLGAVAHDRRGFRSAFSEPAPCGVCRLPASTCDWRPSSAWRRLSPALPALFWRRPSLRLKRRASQTACCPCWPAAQPATSWPACRQEFDHDRKDRPARNSDSGRLRARSARAGHRGRNCVKTGRHSAGGRHRVRSAGLDGHERRGSPASGLSDRRCAGLFDRRADSQRPASGNGNRKTRHFASC